MLTRDEFPLEKAREILKDDVIAILGYGVQGPGQALNLKDNGFNVIIGQRYPSPSWDKALADGWVPGENLFSIEEACERGTILQYLLSDAGQIALWPTVKKYLTTGKNIVFLSWVWCYIQRPNRYNTTGKCRRGSSSSKRIRY